MEALIVLLGLVVLAVPIAVIVLIISHARLSREVRALRAITDELQRDAAREARIRVPRYAAPEAPEEAIPPSAHVTEGTPAESPDASATGEPLPPPIPAAARMEEPAIHPKAPAAPRPPQPRQPSAFDRLVPWLRDNWFYAVAAVSLALAGIFLVQYGIETGLLTPRARVIAALVFGAALIGGGEWIRRRYGDDETSPTAYLPSVLSGAGLVSLMGGVLAARLLYDLIAPGPALGALFVIALFALWLGWRHGPLLAAIGLVGGMAAPFLVGGESDQPQWLLLYFGLLSALGLGIDTLRRWAWISVLSVVGGGVTAVLLRLSDTGNETLTAAFAIYAAALVIMTVLIPSRALSPDHEGPCLTEAVMATRETGRPIFPVMLAAGTLLAACFALGWAAQMTALTWWLCLVLAAGLASLLTLWSRGAPALQDLPALPLLTLLALVSVPELSLAAFEALDARLGAQEELTEQRLPLDLTLILLAAVVCGLAAAWRSLQPGRFAAVWAAVAALFAPVTGLLLEFTWGASGVLGAWPWALHALALAVLMTGLAARYARVDTETRLRTALATVSALACIAFALTVLLTDAALTLALAAVVVSAVALDRRFDLPQMTGFVAAGIVALGYRLLVDPGLDWATSAPVLEMLAAYGGTLAALLLSLWLEQARPRPRARVFLESACWSVGGMTVSLTLYHAIEALVGVSDRDAHWEFGLYAAIWLGTMLAQLERIRLGGTLRWLRAVMAAVFGLVGFGMVALTLTWSNPLLSSETVYGPVLLNTLAPAYLLPGAILVLGALRLTHMRRWQRITLGGAGGALAVFWLGLVIRHAWQGSTEMQLDYGISQPELYSYTVALLLAGAGLFYQALAHRSDALRRAGVLVIGLAVAKVFLIDISGLAGLVRVFSFLLLGLSLAGLAWLNRWVQMQAGRGKEPDTPPA